MNMKSILIAVPTYESIEPQTFKSIWDLKKPEGYKVDFDFVEGYGISHARNKIVKKAIREQYDYVFMVDSDMVLPSEALVMLLSTGKDFISGWCQLRGAMGTGFASFVKNKEDQTEMKIEDLGIEKGAFPIWLTGFSCTLVKTSLFLSIAEDEWFKYGILGLHGLLGEDYYFCGEAQKRGFSIYIHSLVRCGHIKKIVI